MWSRFICTDRGARRQWPVWRALALCLLCFVGSAFGQSIEKALMPGKVIEGHAKYEEECGSCHQRFDRKAQARLCADCHKDVGEDIRRKRGFHGHLDDNTCAACHTEHKGRKAKIIALNKDSFDHDRTGFVLKGAHREIRGKCESCHATGHKLREAKPQCIACHRKDDDKKGHQGGLGDDCAKCHDEAKWGNGKYDHDKTKFKLEDKHRTTGCQDCHANGKFKDTPRDCYSCHKKDDQKDGHHGRFGSKCSNCHTARAWDESVFDHGRDTHYALKGKHRSAECTSCHKNTLYTVKLPDQCVSCHRDDDQKKGHKGSLGDKCETCHNEQEWKKTRFDHDKDSEFPLSGKHATAKCESCHTTGVTVGNGRKGLQKLPLTCIGCHKQDDQKNGHKGKFGEKCETCHNAKDWKQARFDHTKETHFPLKGKHDKAKCASCHTGSLYQDKLATDCFSCHKQDDEKKGHKGQLGKRCETCHNENAWKVERFDHNQSRFPLTGNHGGVACNKCHANPAFRDTPRDCMGCHEKDDVHKRRLGSDCETCHNTRSWKSWDFDHNTTHFKLDGGHRNIECYACHTTAAKGKVVASRACVSCHLEKDVHNGGFGTQCEVCHNVTTWKTVRRRAF